MDTSEDVPATPQQPEPAPAPSGPPRLALTILVLAGLTALLGALSGFGSRWGLWDFRTGFTLLRWAAYGAVAVTVVSTVTLWFTRPGTGRRGFWLVVFAVIVAVPVFAVPIAWRARAGDVPPIHDITTDTNDPPRFVEIAPLRADAPNPVEYPGLEVAIQQREAYPDIRPVILDEPLPQAFERALEAAQAEGWDIVGSDLEAGRIEATDRTFWFGFRDDVVIRLTPNEGRTIVDVRSKSRVGGSDVGTNAERIRGYLARLDG
ncbi:MAG: DUF1499 domain-containing protein [Gemmatimonadota bacterium]